MFRLYAVTDVPACSEADSQSTLTRAVPHRGHATTLPLCDSQWHLGQRLTAGVIESPSFRVSSG